MTDSSEFLHAVDRAIAAVIKTTTGLIKKFDWSRVSDDLTEIVALAATIDWAAFVDGRLTRNIVHKAAAVPRGGLSNEERLRLQSDLQQFDVGMDEIIRSEGACDKQTVLRTIERALLVGLQADVSPEHTEKLRAEIVAGLNNERAQRARVQRSENTKRGKEQLAIALRSLSEKENIPLKAGDKHIDLYIMPKLAKYLPDGIDPPTVRAVRTIISEINRGQL